MISDFLRKVVPDGLIVVARPAGKGFRQVVCEGVDAAAAQAAAFDAEGVDTYFGLGGLLAPFQINQKSGKKEVRVGTNIAALKCLFIDLDVEENNPLKYTSQEEAFAAVRDFCKTAPFAAPMIVSSGGGLHCYWPFDKEVAADQWRVLAKTFKAALLAYGLKADPTRTADASSVLRVVGTHNYKGGTKRPVVLLKDVAPILRKDIVIVVSALAKKYNIAPQTVAKKREASALGDNMEKVYEPSEILKIIEHCPQMARVAANGGDNEPCWYAGVQVARLTVNPIESAKIMSCKHPEYTEAAMHVKLAQLDGKGIGPTTCLQFEVTSPGGCSDCVHKGKITSPIQLGVAMLRHLPEVIEEINLDTGAIEVTTHSAYPYPYQIDTNGYIVLPIKTESGDKTEPVVVHEYELRPLGRTHSERADVESTTWQVKQPHLGWVIFNVEQSLLSKADGLQALLLSKGVYVSASRSKLMVNFMLSYIKKLQTECATEKVFSRLGWREDNTKFVLGESVYNQDGTTSPHQMSSEMKAELPGIISGGTLDAWKDAIQFYNAPGHEAHRFMLYCGFGAPLFHMTGHKGVIVNATGKPGAGKTTTLQVINSIYGHPDKLMFNGTAAGSTPNAMYSSLSLYKNIPFCMDEITRIIPKVFGEFALSVSQGSGKMVNTRAGTLSHNRPSWETMVITSANTDAYVTLSQSRGDAAAEAMRVLQIPFEMPTAYTKQMGDAFIRDLRANYGHAGHVFMQHVVQNYSTLEKQVQAVVGNVDVRAKIATGERFWSGAIGSPIAGALCARRIKLLEDFPIERDYDWVLHYIDSTRRSIIEHTTTPQEALAEFLEARVGETLVLSQTLSRNIAPRIDQMPRGALCIRHEIDAKKIFILKSEFKRYCVEAGISYGEVQEDLELRGVLVDRNRQVVLGKGTEFGKGQVRCWEIDLKELDNQGALQ